MADPENLDKVYAEAGQWVRMCNTIIWQMAAVFVTASIACVGLALNSSKLKTFFATASIILFAVWVLIARIYRTTARDARGVLLHIERSWHVPRDAAVYTMHGQIGFKRFNLFRVQMPVW
jgi:hypothetical protein